MSVKANAPVKIGERKKLQGMVHKYTPNDKGDYVCMYCPKTSRRQSTISEHISRIHPVEAGRHLDPFECPSCLVRFNSASIRDQHIITHHTDTKSHHCTHPACGYEGKHAAALQTHYVRKHMAFDTLITKVSKTEAICNHCNASMKTPSIAYHVARCNPLSPFYKVSKIKSPPGEKDDDDDDDEVVIVVVACVVAKQCVVDKPLVIQSEISDRIETPSESLKPNKPTRHVL